MRLAPLLICSTLIVGCGGSTRQPADSGRSRQPRITRAAKVTFPPKRADGRPWPRVPSALKNRVSGNVYLAAAATEADVIAAGCDRPSGREARFLGANVDEFALSATFRSVPRDSGNPDLNNRPLVSGCIAKWNARDAHWEDLVGCGHYAPAGRRHAIARSGGGMSTCFELLDKPRRFRDSPLTIWVEPPPRTRWIVVRRNFDYSVAYPIIGRRPVLLIYPREAALTWPDRQRTLFPYLVIDKSGLARRLSATGAIAG